MELAPSARRRPDDVLFLCVHRCRSGSAQSASPIEQISPANSEASVSANTLRSHWRCHVIRTSEGVHNSESSFLNITLLVQRFKGLMNVGGKGPVCTATTFSSISSGVDALTRIVDSSRLAIRKRTVNAAMEIPLVWASLMRRPSENAAPAEAKGPLGAS